MVKSTEVKVKGNTKHAETALDRLGKKFGKLDKAGKGLKGGGLSAISAGFALANPYMLAGMAAIGGVVAGVRNLNKNLEKMDAIQKYTQQVNISAEALQGLQYAAARNGLESKNLETGLTRMTRGLVEATKGTGTAKIALDQLGLSASNINSMTVDQQFYAIAEALEGVGTKAERIELARKIFGDDDGKKFVQMINAGTDSLKDLQQRAADLGIIVSQDQVDGAARAKDAMDDLGAVFSGIGMQISANMAPALEWLGKALATAWIWMQKIAGSTAFKTYIEYMTLQYKLMWEALKWTVKMLIDFFKWAGKVTRLDKLINKLGGLEGALDAVRTTFVRIQAGFKIFLAFMEYDTKLYWAYWESLINKVITIPAMFQRVWKTIIDIVGSAGTTIGEIMADIAQIFVDPLSAPSILENVKATFSEGLEDIQGIVVDNFKGSEWDQIDQQLADKQEELRKNLGEKIDETETWYKNKLIELGIAMGAIPVSTGTGNSGTDPDAPETSPALGTQGKLDRAKLFIPGIDSGARAALEKQYEHYSNKLKYYTKEYNALSEEARKALTFEEWLKNTNPQTSEAIDNLLSNVLSNTPEVVRQADSLGRTLVSSLNNGFKSSMGGLGVDLQLDNIHLPFMLPDDLEKQINTLYFKIKDINDSEIMSANEKLEALRAIAPEVTKVSGEFNLINREVTNFSKTLGELKNSPFATSEDIERLGQIENTFKAISQSDLSMDEQQAALQALMGELANLDTAINNPDFQNVYDRLFPPDGNEAVIAQLEDLVLRMQGVFQSGWDSILNDEMEGGKKWVAIRENMYSAAWGWLGKLVSETLAANAKILLSHSGTAIKTTAIWVAENSKQFASSVATAAANIWKAYSGLPFIGQVLAAAAIGAMLVSLSKFHDGGLVGSYGSKGEVPILAQQGEFIMPVDRTKEYLPLLEAMRSGNDVAISSGGVGGSQVTVNMNSVIPASQNDARHIAETLRDIELQSSRYNV